MKYNIVYTDDFDADLKNIISYLSEFYESTPKKFLVKLKSKIQLLADNPFIYEKYRYRPDFRKIVIDDYLLFYHVDKDKKLIIIHHIFHEKINIEKALNK